MDWLTSPAAWIALVTLTALEIVLGIDNIIFISILAGRLPRNSRRRARPLGLGAGDAHAHRPAVLARRGSCASRDRCSPCSATSSPAAI